MVFSEVVGTLSFLQPQNDDDITDRMHYYYTSTFLLVTAVLISLKMFGGRPLECFMPAEFRSSWEDYTEIFCWASNTYWVDKNEEFPTSEDGRRERMISYYQWSPFFLVVCAFLFYSPCLIWRILYTKSGIKLTDLMVFANDRSNIQPQRREANLRGMAVHLGSVFQHRYKFGTEHEYHHRYLRLLNFRYYEAYLTILYLFIKGLYLLNVLSQIFIILWIWYTFLAVTTLFSLINWTISTLPFDARKNFIARRLQLTDIDFEHNHNESTLDEFVSDYIKIDGAYVLKMLTVHAGMLMCAELVDLMWEDFKKQRLEQKTAAVLEAGGGALPGRRKVSMLQPLVARDFVQPPHPGTPLGLAASPAEAMLLRP